jgi:hypothetical protein
MGGLASNSSFTVLGMYEYARACSIYHAARIESVDYEWRGNTVTLNY